MAAPYTRPDFTAQSATQYKTNLDAAAQVFERLAGWFQPQAQATPDMTVRVGAGWLFSGTTLTEVAEQNTAPITAPGGGNSRIDRVVVDAVSGAVSVITGTPSVSPAVPALPSGKIPVARVPLTSSTTAITNSMIIDERAFSAGSGGVGSAGWVENAGVTITTGATGTVALKDAAGADPSAASPVNVYAQSATETTGTYTARTRTSSLSMSLTSGGTLGTINGQPARIYVGLLDNAGTLELCVWNSLILDSSGVIGLFAVQPGGIYSTTAMGAAADNAGVIYSTNARSNVRVFPIAYFDVVPATAGNWSTAIDRLVLIGPRTKITGDLIQSVATRYTTTGSVTGTTFADSGLTASITPTSKSNPIRASFTMAVGADANQGHLFRIIRGSTSILSGASAGSRTLVTHAAAPPGAGYLGFAHLQTMDLPNSVSSTTYKVQMASGGLSSVYINRSSTDTDGSNYQRGASIEILEEICA